MALTKKEQDKQLGKYTEQIQSKKLIQLTTKGAKKLRKEYWKAQGEKCPILGTKISFEDSTCDHMHRKMSDPYGGKDWLGLIRGILHKRSNSWEGKCYNAFKRLGLGQFIGFSDALRNLAEYIDNPTVPYGFIYPSEAPKNKRKKLGKRDYNKVIKYYKKVYPKRKKYPKKIKYLTKVWEKYIADVEVYLQKEQKLKKRRQKL